LSNWPDLHSEIFAKGDSHVPYQLFPFAALFLSGVIAVLIGAAIVVDPVGIPCNIRHSSWLGRGCCAAE
jgi:hypothetical protein